VADRYQEQKTGIISHHNCSW